MGEGGRGRVYRAEYRGPGSPPYEKIIAIKTFSPQELQKIKHLKRIINIVTRFYHPFLTRIYELLGEGGYYYLLMEFVEGEELSRKVKREGPYPLKKGVNLAIKMARGLSYIHRRGLIYGDFKLENVRVDETKDKLKITDLDSSLQIHRGWFPLRRWFRGKSLKKRIEYGTLAYLPPEQILGKGLIPQSDIYSFGVSLYFLFTGKFPFASELKTTPWKKTERTYVESLIRQEVIEKHLKGRFPSPSTFRSDLPSLLEEIILKSMERSPFQRYQSMEDVLEDLYRVWYGLE